MMLTKENLIDGSALSTLRHCHVTNLSDGRISNHDATLLIMIAAAGCDSTVASIKKQLRQWRGDDALLFTYLWNKSSEGGYGFVGRNIDAAYNDVHRYTSRGSNNNYMTRRRTYWYRSARGCYSITIEGFRRLGELVAEATLRNKV